MLTREQWLNARRKSIGASDVAAILGYDDRRGPLDIYHAKVKGFSQDDNDWMKFGRNVEGAVGELYVDRTGRRVYDMGATEIQYHSEIPWLGATLDRVVYNEEHEAGPLELKFMGMFDNPKKFSISPPAKFQIQNQIQMACTGATFGAIAAMFTGYQMAHKDMVFSEKFFKAAFPLLESFWKCVQDKEPPKLTRHKRALDAVKRIWNEATEGKVVAIPSDAMGMVKDWEENKSREKGFKYEKEFNEAKLREILKDADYGALVDGTFLSLRPDVNGRRVLRRVKKMN
jgi:putative phage-type endonuclease